MRPRSARRTTKITKTTLYKTIFVSFVFFAIFVVRTFVAVAGAQVVPLASPHWPPNSAIRVWIDPANAPSGGVALVEKALQTWTHAADGRFTLSRARTRDEAQITIKFVSSDTNYGETAPKVDAEKRFITSADIGINAATPNDQVDARIVVYLTALHELGHALGLPHTDSMRDIMYSFRAPDDGAKFFGNYRKLLTSVSDIGGPMATGLSPRDVSTLRALYDR